MYEISLIGFGQSVVAVLLFITKKPRLISNVVLTTWLLVISVQMMFDIVFIRSDHHLMNFAVLNGILQLTYGPLLYLYAKTLLMSKQVFKKQYFLHFSPFLIAFLYFLMFQLNRDNPFTAPEMNAFSNPPKDAIVFGLSITLSMIIYLVLIKKLLYNHSKTISYKSSFNPEEISLTWLNTTVFIFALIIISDNVLNILHLLYHKSIFNPILILKTGIIIVVYTLIYYASRKPENTDSVIDNSNDNKPINGEEFKSNDTTLAKYKRSGLKQEEKDSILETLNNYMEDNKPYLKSALTIYDLSKETNIPKHYITQIINEKLNKNFYTFVNEYRVVEFKRRLADPENAHFTIMSIAFESGFNSKTGFNNIFKKIEKLTPSEYRNLCLNKKLNQ